MYKILSARTIEVLEERVRSEKMTAIGGPFVWGGWLCQAGNVPEGKSKAKGK